MRRRKRRTRPKPLKYWWILPLVALVVMAPWLWGWVSLPHFKHQPLPGYISDTAKLEDEYLQYTGKPIEDAGIAREFDQAADFMLLGNYANAVTLLEGASRQAAVPVIFNDLGVLYMKIRDGSHAIKAFRDALARNHDYQPVRASLKILHMGQAADPSNDEVEPNNTNADANVVWLDRSINGTLNAAVGDIDCYWFTTPRPPRDRTAVQVLNHSITLIPRVRVLDSGGTVLTGFKEATTPGDSVRFDFSPPSNTTYYVQVEGASGSSGAYTLAVNPLHAFDVYEPNDDILNATRATLGQHIEANIMDTNDTDFYSFVSPVAGSVNIDIVSRNATLVPGLSTFAPDLRHSGFGPEVKEPGGSLHHVMKVEANQPYYVQVWAKGDTAGPYSLSIK